MGGCDLRGGVMPGRGRFLPFVEEKPPQAAQIIEQPAAGLQVLLQFIQLELDDLQSLHPALRLGVCREAEVGRDLAFGFRNGLNQKLYVSVGVLYTVKRGLWGSIQEILSDAKLWRRGWDLNPRYPLRYVRFRGGSFQPLTHLSGKQLSVDGSRLKG
jgi:hypothetical protein